MDTEGTQIDSEKNYPHSELTERIIGAAFDVHNELGWGFLEKVYENALLVELRHRGLPVVAQPEIPVKYKGKAIGVYNGDLLVAGSVLVEIKALSALNSVHEQQILHYLKATGLKVGLLLNFGTHRLQIKRLVF
ncbi:MAG TPA: GxxExxY protein [Dehalococcoidia bacterium]|nr:GxxExxY protein [Dehalococcoidia bacterium]